MNNESYDEIKENPFLSAKDEPLSTFSLDVDKAAYSNVKRMLNMGHLPPKDAIRIEEMVNYFHYEYPYPVGDDIIHVSTTYTDCPWNSKLKLLHIGLQSKMIEEDKLPLSNLVFLIDVSGSMSSANRLPLVVSSMKILLNKLRDEDRVAIVTYAGIAGVALESTPVREKDKILDVLNSLRAGGSTAGAEGIQTAYKIAQKNFIEGGNNRVVLATDGDFNVGITDAKSLEKFIAEKRKTGVFLSVLGYGMGNYKDNRLQLLANKGNGNHAYINDLQEANKVLAFEFAGTMHTIAKDVKFQLEFNPQNVAFYRLVGYENRMLNAEDFNDDSKDAGELGVGHQMTAIYEIIPAGQSDYPMQIDELKYQSSTNPNIIPQFHNELATIKFRYKAPDSDISQKWEQVVTHELVSLDKTNDDIRFSAAVAYSGLLLRESRTLESDDFTPMIKLAKSARGKDDDGYKAEFVRLMKAAKELKRESLAVVGKE
jgi:Ca-activated chloride channel family protein